MSKVVLDPSIVQGLRELGEMPPNGADQIKHLVQTFIDDARSRLLLLLEAVRGEDTDEVGSLAHTLAGSSGNLGAVVVAELCRDIEASARVGALPEVRGLVDSLAKALSDSFVALRREFGLDA